MGKLILRRLLLLIPILLGLTLLVFLFIRALPGDPPAPSWGNAPRRRRWNGSARRWA